MIKTQGKDGKYQQETMALMEYFNIFMKLTNPDFLLLPESVEDHLSASKRFFDDVIDDFGKPIPKMANGVFNFQKSNLIYEAVVTGHFEHYFKYLQDIKSLKTSDSTHEFIYGFEHHDEIYGFASQERFIEMIKDAKGIVYKQGASKGVRLASILKEDSFRIIQAQKFFMAHRGSILIFEGTELGHTNNYRHAYEVTIANLLEMRNKGIIDSDNMVFQEIDKILADDNISLELPLSDEYELLNKYIDGRLLHRRPTKQDEINIANRGDHHLYKSISSIISKRKSSLALSKGGPENAINTMDSQVGSFARRFKDKDKIIDEVAVVTNGSNHVKRLNLSVADLTDKNQFQLIRIDQENEQFPFTNNGPYISIELRPYETIWLRIIDQ